MKKRRLISLLLVLVMMFGLVACGGANNSVADAPEKTPNAAEKTPANEDEQITITFTSWMFTEEGVKETYQYMLDKYMELHPNVKIEVVAWPWAQYKDQLVMSVASGDVPDISQLESEWLPALYDLDALYDLNELLDEEVINDFYPNMLTTSTFDGKLAGVPFFVAPTAMFYNKTLLDKAGVKEVPDTWEEMMAAAEAISALGTDENGNKIYGYCLPNEKSSGGNGYNFFTHMWNYGGEFCDADGNIKILSEENIAAFEEARWLYKNEISPNGADMKSARNLFGQGQVGFFYDIQRGITSFTQASEKGDAFLDEIGVMCVPGRAGNEGTTWAALQELCVYKDTKHPEVCADIIDFLTSEICLQRLYDDGMGKMPSRVSVNENMDCFANPTDPFIGTFVEQLNTAIVPPTYQEHFAEADEAFADALGELTYSDATTAEIVEKLDARVKAAYGQ